MSFKRGDKVRVLLDGDIEIGTDNRDPNPEDVRVKFDARVVLFDHGSLWVPIEHTHHKGSSEAIATWREIVADAIRDGNDRAALELLATEMAKKGRLYALINQAIKHVFVEEPLCPNCEVDPDPRGWSACFACRQLRGFKA